MTVTLPSAVPSCNHPTQTLLEPSTDLVQNSEKVLVPPFCHTIHIFFAHAANTTLFFCVPAYLTTCPKKKMLD